MQGGKSLTHGNFFNEETDEQYKKIKIPNPLNDVLYRKLHEKENLYKVTSKENKDLIMDHKI